MDFDMSLYEPPVKYTAEYVLDQVDELLIYRHYLGNFTLNKKCKHPFRTDKHPSFCVFFGTERLKLLWKDFTTGESGDCFSLIGKIFKLNYYQAIEKVASDFGIIKGQITISKKQIEEARSFREEFARREILIQVKRRAMNTEELAYWAKYNISREDLLANNIFAIDKLWVNKKLINLSNNLHFGYYFPDSEKWKIYSPDDKEYKWFGNVSTFEMEGISELKYVEMCGEVERPGEPIIITKSRKDRIILKKLYHNVCSCQNESEGAIPKEMDEVFGLAEGKYCWFDNDEPGKAANRKLNHRGYKWINVPNILYDKYGIKDPSDVISHFGWTVGKEILLQELRKKEIL